MVVKDDECTTSGSETNNDGDPQLLCKTVRCGCWYARSRGGTSLAWWIPHKGKYQDRYWWTRRGKFDDKIEMYYEALKCSQENKTPETGWVRALPRLLASCRKMLYQRLKFRLWTGTTINFNLQKQALISLLEKKGKIGGLSKKWRPISLINVYIKIALKVIARRLELFLPNIIRSNQNDRFIKGKLTLDGVQTIEDVLEFAKFTDCSGISPKQTTTIYLQSNFDNSLSHK